MKWKILPIKEIPEEVSQFINYIKGAVEYAKKKRLKLDDLYENPDDSEDGKIQEVIRISTRSLTSKFSAVEHFNASNIKQSDLENALKTVNEARLLFGNHPFNNVLYGRIVYIATEASKAGLRVPDKYASCVGEQLPSWQDPHLNYSTPSDLKSKKDREKDLPSEWRR
ncbi:MAG: hypothetical protein AABW75_04755 [Nanoarchaeota archaeon]